MSLAPAPPPQGQRIVLALIEINRFESLRRTVGPAVAADQLGILADRLRDFANCRSVRPDRHHVEAVLALDDGAETQVMLADVAARIAATVDIRGYQFALSVRIGAAEARDGTIDDALLGQAERALTRAAEERRPIAIARAEDESAFASRFALLRGLQEAIREDRLDLHYQPKIRARTGETAALEALVRWNDPVEGMIPPMRFIGLAEESGDIGRLTQWVIQRAIADQARMMRAGYRMPIDINISGVMIADAGFAWDTLMMFTAVQGDIGFEITETAMIADPARALENLRTIADAGIKLAIDDYGSGFSSLAYLQQLPVSELKIDRTFISRLTSGQRDPLLVRSTIELAHALDMEVTAEGVDNPQALALLQVMGCDLLQGFYLSRPLPYAALIDFLAGETSRLARPAPAPQGMFRPRTAAR